MTENHAEEVQEFVDSTWLCYSDIARGFDFNKMFLVDSLSGCGTFGKVFSIRASDCISIQGQNCETLGS